LHPSCPISSKYIDSRLIRLVSFQVTLIAAVILLTENIFFTALLFFYFLMRTLRVTQMSPFYLSAKYLLAFRETTPGLCNEAQKRFSLYMGLVLSGILLFLFILKQSYTTTLILEILFICALLESLFEFCIGCKIYSAIEILNPLKRVKKQ